MTVTVTFQGETGLDAAAEIRRFCEAMTGPARLVHPHPASYDESTNCAPDEDRPVPAPSDASEEDARVEADDKPKRGRRKKAEKELPEEKIDAENERLDHAEGIPKSNDPGTPPISPAAQEEPEIRANPEDRKEPEDQIGTAVQRTREDCRRIMEELLAAYNKNPKTKAAPTKAFLEAKEKCLGGKKLADLNDDEIDPAYAALEKALADAA